MPKVNVKHSIFSGQVFMWEGYSKEWYIVNGDDVLYIHEDEPTRIISYRNRDYDLFRLGDDNDLITSAMSKDSILTEAYKRFEGLRLLRQDPFQCYISFILSSNSSIGGIRHRMFRLAKKFGKKILFDKKHYSLFPEPKKLAAAEISDLLSCGLGYRGKFVKSAANAVKEKQIDFEELKKANYDSAKSALLSIDGIGNKVADCILLFSLEKLESFPLDRWIIRSLQNYYPQKFLLEGKTLTPKKYQTLHEKIVDYFGPYAGYCQQFLFKMIRESNHKRW